MTATGSGALQSTTTERQHRSTEKQSARQGGIYCGGRLAVVACKHIGVDGKRDAGLRMTEAFADGHDVHTAGDELACVGVPQPMEGDFRHADSPGERAPVG